VQVSPEYSLSSSWQRLTSSGIGWTKFRMSFRLRIGQSSRRFSAASAIPSLIEQPWRDRQVSTATTPTYGREGCGDGPLGLSVLGRSRLAWAALVRFSRSCEAASRRQPTPFILESNG
jgi:hypothetical protein